MTDVPRTERQSRIARPTRSVFLVGGAYCRVQLHFEAEYKFLSQAVPVAFPFFSEVRYPCLPVPVFEAGVPSARSRF